MQQEKPFDSRLSNFKNRGALKTDEIRRRREVSFQHIFGPFFDLFPAENCAH